MRSLKPLNDKIFVVKYDKARKHRESSPFSPVMTNDNLGVVEYSDNEGVQVGSKVYFGSSYERINIEGKEVYVMDITNIFALLEGQGDDY